MTTPGNRSGRTTSRPLGVGLLVPQWEGHLAGQTPRWTDALAVAQAAEAVGFDTLWIIDDLLIDIAGARFGVWECWSWTAALAAATQHIALGTFVCANTHRNPACWPRSPRRSMRSAAGGSPWAWGPAAATPSTAPSASIGSTASTASRRASASCMSCCTPDRATSAAPGIGPRSASCARGDPVPKACRSWSERSGPARGCCGPRRSMPMSGPSCCPGRERATQRVFHSACGSRRGLSPGWSGPGIVAAFGRDRYLVGGLPGQVRDLGPDGACDQGHAGTDRRGACVGSPPRASTSCRSSSGRRPSPGSRPSPRCWSCWTAGKPQGIVPHARLLKPVRGTPPVPQPPARR